MDTSNFKIDFSNVRTYEFIDADIHTLAREMVQKSQDAEDLEQELRYSLGTIIFSFTSIEIFLNKIIDPRIGFLNDTTSKMSSRLKNEFEKFPLTEKIELLFLLTDKSLDRGSEPFQSVDLLRQLRNFIIHYSPIGDVVSLIDKEPDKIEKIKLERKLSDKFKVTKIEGRDDTFLNRCINKNCAIWSFSLTIQLIEFICENFDLDETLFLTQPDS